MTHRSAFATRRRLLRRAAGIAAAGMLAPWTGSRLLAQPALSVNPFTLGVASGDPLPGGFVIWTRLAPDPMHSDALPQEPIPVRWEVAEDDQMRAVVRSGFTLARPDHAHAVHVEVEGLRPGRPYWYRFRAGDAESPVGRSRTAPVALAPTDRLRLAITSCQHYEQGLFTGYRDMVDQDPDLILHLGDYIYESSYGLGMRRHPGPEPVDLDGYRRYHAIYRTDPYLQAAHAAAPWRMIWDDHEVDNDYAADMAEDWMDTEAFVARRAAAYKAYWEHLPLRLTNKPRADGMTLHGRSVWGDLAVLTLLDTRQYRDNQPCETPGVHAGARVHDIADCPEAEFEGRSMLGAQQEAFFGWLLTAVPTQWTVIAQTTLFSRLDQFPDERRGFWSDGWDAYAANRRRMLDAIAERQPPNPVVLGGDMHSTWVSDVKADWSDPDSATLASEFVCTSMTSAPGNRDMFLAMLPANPHIKHFESRYRGYTMCDITPERWLTTHRTVDSVMDPDTGFATADEWVVEAGAPGAVRV